MHLPAARDECFIWWGIQAGPSCLPRSPGSATRSTTQHNRFANPDPQLTISFNLCIMVAWNVAPAP